MNEITKGNATSTTSLTYNSSGRVSKFTNPNQRLNFEKPRRMTETISGIYYRESGQNPCCMVENPGVVQGHSKREDLCYSNLRRSHRSWQLLQPRLWKILREKNGITWFAMTSLQHTQTWAAHVHQSKRMEWRIMETSVLTSQPDHEVCQLLRRIPWWRSLYSWFLQAASKVKIVQLTSHQVSGLPTTKKVPHVSCRHARK